MKRMFDIILALSLLTLFAPAMLLIALLVKVTSRGGVLHWSGRVGQYNRIFQMPKFRSMRVDTPQLATHLLADSNRWITPVGFFLRKTSLDELPQLWSVLRGDMSLVGPRPALFNQDDLVAKRTWAGVHELAPGITGWAQVNGRDELSIPEKVVFDAYYLHHKSMVFDIWILFLTVIKVLRREGIKQVSESVDQTSAQRGHPSELLEKPMQNPS